MLNQSHILYFPPDLFMKVGKTLSYGNGRLDDGKALAELGFEVKIFFSLHLCLIILQILLLTWFVNVQIGDR